MSRREEIARLLHDANTGRITPDETDPTKYWEMAQAVLDWMEPTALPATLRTVEDVAAVCAAEGLIQFSKRSSLWRSGAVFVDTGFVSKASIECGDGDGYRRVAVVYLPVSAELLTAAIRAARTAGETT